MSFLSYESIELLTKTITQKLSGLNLIIHPLHSFGKPTQRIVFKSTPYVEDDLFRKWTREGSTFFLEFSIDEDPLTEKYCESLTKRMVNVLMRCKSNTVFNSLPDIKRKPMKMISENEWKELDKDYKKALEDYKTCPVDDFPWVIVKPRSTNSKFTTLCLETPSEYGICS